jgi:nicotinamide riboside transporter PnuC
MDCVRRVIMVGVSSALEGVLVNLISCCLCLWNGLYPTALLFTIYTVISVFGYFKWAKLTKES